MNSVLTAANIIFRAIGRNFENFTNFFRSASSVDRVSQEIYSQQAFYIYYTFSSFYSFPFFRVAYSYTQSKWLFAYGKTKNGSLLAAFCQWNCAGNDRRKSGGL
jgi:hypothetical protein